MKPYLVVLWNKLRFSLKKKFICPQFNVKGISLLGYNTKISVGHSSKVYIGDRVISDGRFVLMVGDGAVLSIGNRVYFNEDSMISCKGRVHIGNRCRFGPNVKIFDNNHMYDFNHGVRDEHKVGTVLIGDNCWIGANVVLLKGTEIGDNSVIGAGCVIDGYIPPCSIVTQSRELHIRPMKEL